MPKPFNEERVNPLPYDIARPLTAHLEEFRKRLIVSLIAFSVCFVACWFYVDPVIGWLARPVGNFFFTSPSEAFMARVQVASACAVLIASPIILYQAWGFISVALEVKERMWVVGVVPASVALFYFGIALAVFLITPLAAKFLLAFGGPYLHPMITLDSYLSFVIWMSIGFGLFFQVPVAVVVLSRLGVINPWKLAAYRSHVIVATFIIAAVLTPGPDIISQFSLAIPSYLMFEISLIIARRVAKPGNR